jgi:hypothetical protein
LDGRFEYGRMKKGVVVFIPKPYKLVERDSDEMGTSLIIDMGSIVVGCNNGVVGKNIFIGIAFLNRDINEWKVGKREDVLSISSLGSRKVGMEYIPKMLMLLCFIVLCEEGKMVKLVDYARIAICLGKSICCI